MIEIKLTKEEVTVVEAALLALQVQTEEERAIPRDRTLEEIARTDTLERITDIAGELARATRLAGFRQERKMR